MSERLHHLKRQRTLLREHLAWIETEIARETADASGTDHTPTLITQAASSADSVPVPAKAATPPSLPLISDNAANTAVTTDADTLIRHYAENERQDPGAVKRGCLLIFVGILGAVASAIVAIWLIYY